MRFGAANLLPLVAAAWLLAGCASVTGPDVLVVAPGEYQVAFDAAVEAARKEGLPAALRDRRAGIIETESVIAPSIFEPWHSDASSPEARNENTLALQRRRARFEFTPGAASAAEAADVGLSGPDVLGLAQPDPDRTHLEDPLRLTVSVWVERAHQPGLRRNTWTRKATTRSRIGVGGRDADPDELLPRVFWTPVSRDRDIERHLLAAVANALGRPEAEATASP